MDRLPIWHSRLFCVILLFCFCSKYPVCRFLWHFSPNVVANANLWNMVQSFGASFPLSREGTADAPHWSALQSNISLSLCQNTKCNFVTFWTSFYFHPVSVVAEQSMPACFQILRYLTGPLVLGILKKSCNVVQACLGNWQTWYFSAKIRQYWYWYWYWYWSTMQILIKQNSVQDSQKELLSIAGIIVCLDNYWNHTLTGRSNFIGISLLPPVLILEAEGRCSLCQGGPTVQCRYKGRPYGAVLWHVCATCLREMGVLGFDRWAMGTGHIFRLQERSFTAGWPHTWSPLWQAASPISVMGCIVSVHCREEGCIGLCCTSDFPRHERCAKGEAQGTSGGLEAVYGHSLISRDVSGNTSLNQGQIILTVQWINTSC